MFQFRCAIVALVSLFVASIAGWGMSSGESAETRSDHAPTYEPAPTPSPVEVAHEERSVEPVVYSDPGFDFEEEPPPVLHEDEIEWADEMTLTDRFAGNAGKPWLPVEDMHQRFDLLVERVGVEPDSIQCEKEDFICEIGWDVLDVPLQVLADAAHDTLIEAGSIATAPVGEGIIVVVTRAPPVGRDLGLVHLHILARRETYHNRPVEGIREVDP